MKKLLIAIALVGLVGGMSFAETKVYGDSLFPSGVSGTSNEIIVTDNGDSTITISAPRQLTASYGELNVNDDFGTLTVDILGANNWIAVAVNNATSGSLENGLSKGAGFVTISNATGAMTIGASGAGVYKAESQMSFNAGSGNSIHGAFFIDDVEQTKCEVHRKIGTGNDIGAASTNCLITLSVGEAVDYRVRNSSDVDVVIEHLNWNIFRIDD